MELIPQGYIARYTMDDLHKLVAENLKKLGKELTEPQPVSSVVGGKTVWLFKCTDSAGAAAKPKKKYNYTKKPKLSEGEYTIRYSAQDSEGNEVQSQSIEVTGVLAGPVTPL